MNVSAVVVSYNSAKQLPGSIRSLWSNGVADVVVIDNNSKDESRTIAQRFGACTIHNRRNVGFAQACNRGMAQASSPLVLLLNPDATLVPGALQRAVPHFADPNVAAVGLKLIGTESSIELDNWGSVVTPAMLFVRHVRTAQTADEACSVGWSSGGALLVRRSLWNQLGGFDPTFFLYWEDVDFGRRVNERGYAVVFEPGAEVQHVRGASSPDSHNKTRIYDLSADAYFRKHYSYPIWLTQRLVRRLYRLSSPRVR